MVSNKFATLHKIQKMELLIGNIKSKDDSKLFINLANRLGLTTKVLTLKDKEDIGLAMAIEEGRKSGYVSEKKVMKTLNKVIEGR